MTPEKFASISTNGGIGRKWTNWFVEKHLDRIKMSWAACLEAKRGQAVNEHTVKAWFDLVEMVKTKYSIADENTYAVDEVGTNPLNGEWEWVMGGKKEGPQYQQ